MHGDTELLLNACDEFGDRQRWRSRALLEHELQDGRRKFVRAVRAAFARNQSGKALLRHRTLGLIERRTRQPEGCGGFGHGRFVDFDTAQHLVFHLQKIPGVEEVFRLEQRIGDGLRMGIEDALLTESLNLGRIGPGRGHGNAGQPFCVYNYAAYRSIVKQIIGRVARCTSCLIA